MSTQQEREQRLYVPGLHEFLTSLGPIPSAEARTPFQRWQAAEMVKQLLADRYALEVRTDG